ncbi:hypothetical protein R1flu_008379 [Riccia fluitans]|uniref:Uncharacterized protein n=1 Tax=Riccia fluitans TaxID=41844 RepID=A0ABD1YBJ1_9MARC
MQHYSTRQSATSDPSPARQTGAGKRAGREFDSQFASGIMEDRKKALKSKSGQREKSRQAVNEQEGEGRDVSPWTSSQK